MGQQKMMRINNYQRKVRIFITFHIVGNFDFKLKACGKERGSEVRI